MTAWEDTALEYRSIQVEKDRAKVKGSAKKRPGHQSRKKDKLYFLSMYDGLFHCWQYGLILHNLFTA